MSFLPPLYHLHHHCFFCHLVSSLQVGTCTIAPVLGLPVDFLIISTAYRVFAGVVIVIWLLTLNAIARGWQLLYISWLAFLAVSGIHLQNTDRFPSQSFPLHCSPVNNTYGIFLAVCESHSCAHPTVLSSEDQFYYALHKWIYYK